MKCAGLIFLLFSVVSARAFTPSDADVAFNAFNAKFYALRHGFAHYKKDTTGGHADFWMQAEEIEMIEDVYERTGGAVSKRMIGESIAGFTNRFHADWSENKFNDDLIWMTIACARGYLDTSNTAFADLAKHNFHVVIARGLDDQLGGGIWWSTDRACKNSCINGPATIAASLLFQITADQSCLTNAEAIYAWERRALFNPATGAVHDNIGTNGNLGRKAFTYNEGTFIGAANLLWKITGDTNYFNDAQLAANFTKDRLCTDGILPAYGSGDAAGFNGILIRWLARFARENHLWPQYQAWLTHNADAAWSLRNQKNLSWQDWKSPTPSGTLPSWNCSATVVILHLVPPS